MRHGSLPTTTYLLTYSLPHTTHDSTLNLHPHLHRPHPPRPHQARTIEASNKAYEARDAAQHEMSGLKAQVRRDPDHHADYADHAGQPLTMLAHA